MECRYCFGDVNSKAQKCQHCGEWLKQAQPNEREDGLIDTFVNSKNLNQTVNSGIKLYAGYYIISGVVGLILFIVMFIFIMGKGSEMERQHKQRFNSFPSQDNVPPEVKRLLEQHREQNKNKALPYLARVV